MKGSSLALREPLTCCRPAWASVCLCGLEWVWNALRWTVVCETLSGPDGASAVNLPISPSLGWWSLCRNEWFMASLSEPQEAGRQLVCLMESLSGSSNGHVQRHPHPQFRKASAERSLSTLQFWTQPTKPFWIHRIWVCTCNSNPPDIGISVGWVASSHSPNLNTIGRAVPDIYNCGVRVLTCGSTPTRTFGNAFAKRSQSTYQIWTQSVQPILR